MGHAFLMALSAQRDNTFFQLPGNGTILVSDEVGGIVLKNRFSKPLGLLDDNSTGDICVKFE